MGVDHAAPPRHFYFFILNFDSLYNKIIFIDNE